MCQLGTLISLEKAASQVADCQRLAERRIPQGSLDANNALKLSGPLRVEFEAGFAFVGVLHRGARCKAARQLSFNEMKGGSLKKDERSLRNYQSLM
jgi:hypothetical protein